MTLAKEQVSQGVRVNIVAPGLTESEMGARLVKATRGVDDMSELAHEMPFGRVSTPRDVAAAVAWLVSGANPYASGQKINIDGGKT